MWHLEGGPARTPFQLAKLLDLIQAITPAIRAAHARDVYLVDEVAPLAVEHKARLGDLLQGTAGQTETANTIHFVVTPRPGTISPWSSKATEICHGCGLASVVRRVERGVLWSLDGWDEVADATKQRIIALCHDRMTEAVLASVAEAACLFQTASPGTLRTVPVLAGGKAALATANQAWGLALSDDEVDYLVGAFQELGRDPTDAELMMFAQANSEHCRHKIFNAKWTLDGEEMPNSLFGMIKNTHEKSPGGTLSAYSDNAAVVRGPTTARFFPNVANRVYGASTEPVHLLMKVETHNHPTGISPGPGAATGSGGEIRDEGAVGKGSKPKAGLTGFMVSHLRDPEHAEPWEARNPGHSPRMASPLDIMIEAPIGGARYNNEFGRPNLCGLFRTFEQEVERPDGPEWRGYHKPIMLAGGYGNVRDAHVLKDGIVDEAPIVVLGGPAMLIGLGGGAASSMATGASTEDLDFASVQRANPEIERRCQEVIDRCWALGDDNPIMSIHDVGAGGLSNALPELVHDADKGARFDLRSVPNAEPGMTPMEIWCNEAQERYVIALHPDRREQFEALCARERCPYAIVGQATSEERLGLRDEHHGNDVIDLPLGVLFGKAPRMHRHAASLTPATQPLDVSVFDPSEAAARVLRFPAVADKRFLITIGDRSITGMVVRDQMVGPHQVAVADCAVTTTGYTGTTGEAMSMGERTPCALIDSPAAGRMAIGEALTNLAAADVALEKVVLSANWMVPAGHPGEDVQLYKTVETIGMELCPALGISIPVGKDSMSMRAEWGDGASRQKVTAPLSLVVSAFAPVGDVRLTADPQLRTDKGPSRLLWIDLGAGKMRMGGSTLAQVYGELGATPPDLDNPAALRAMLKWVRALAQDGALWAYHDRSDGGLLATVAESCFAGGCGAEIDLTTFGDPMRALFNEELGALLQVPADRAERLVADMRADGLAGCVHDVGTVTPGQAIRFHHNGQVFLEGDRGAWREIWGSVSHRIASRRDNPVCADEERDLPADDPGLQPHLTFPLQHNPAPAATYTRRPRVAILREQGVNGQIEMAAAFHQAGFEAVDVHMSDLIAGREDLTSMTGLAACGGFSYGDVLGAGGGWAKSILYDPEVRAVFERFFARPDTFSLGVCNGCQMLSQLRDLIPGADHWPRFLHNTSAQFEARYVMTEVLNSPSIFFQGMEGSRIPIAIAHGEGRVAWQADGDAANAHIALRYVDNHGQPTERYPLNPNGSPGGVTALTSADGRATILMPHPERVFRTLTCSWTPDDWGEYSPWMRFFRNARAWCGE